MTTPPLAAPAKANLPLVIFGSAHRAGQTRATVAAVFDGMPYDFVDLGELNISSFAYDHRNANDDFIPLAEKMVAADTIVLATPVYWYAPSAQMKAFIDRWSDLLTIRKDLGAALAGRRLFVICSYGTDFPLGCAAFEAPLRMTCHYMNIDYAGCYYAYTGDGSEGVDHSLASLTEFRQAIHQGADLQARDRIRGEEVSLRLAGMADREALWPWWAHSAASTAEADHKGTHGAKPSDAKLAQSGCSLEAFKALWQPFYYQKPLTSRGHVLMIERAGEAVGGIAFHRPDAKGRAQMEVWLRSQEAQDDEAGRDAVTALCRYLYRQFGMMFFWAMPAASQPAQVELFVGAGFKRLPLNPAEGQREFASACAPDRVYVLKDMSLDL